jgi:UDP-glucuronate 4-epimerase
MAIHKFCRLVENGDPVPVFGDGSSSRDYTYVDDAVGGTVAALDRAPRGFSIYNLGNTHPVPLARLVELVGEALGKTPIIDRRPHQPGDVMRTWAAVDAARRDLGYEPRVSIEDGLARFVDWMRRQP